MEFNGHQNTDTFRVEGLSKDQLTIAAICVNMADGEQRPWASEENLQFFMAPFVRESVQGAIDGGGLTDAGVEIAKTLL